MMRLLIHWIVSAVLLLVVSRVVPGFEVRTLGAAFIAAAVIGLVNATLGLILKVLTFPLTILTFGIFLLVINALMIMLASRVVSGFVVHGFAAAFWGALVLALLQMVVKWATPSTERR
jgi:putative membrane protein